MYQGITNSSHSTLRVPYPAKYFWQLHATFALHAVARKVNIICVHINEEVISVCKCGILFHCLAVGVILNICQKKDELMGKIQKYTSYDQNPLCLNYQDKTEE